MGLPPYRPLFLGLFVFLADYSVGLTCPQPRFEMQARTLT